MLRPKHLRSLFNQKSLCKTTFPSPVVPVTLRFNEFFNVEYLLNLIRLHLQAKIADKILHPDDLDAKLKQAEKLCKCKDFVAIAAFCSEYTTITLIRDIGVVDCCEYCGSELVVANENITAEICIGCEMTRVIPSIVVESTPYDSSKTFLAALDDFCGHSTKNIPEKELIDNHMYTKHGITCDEIAALPLQINGKRGNLTIVDLRAILKDIGCNTYYDTVHTIAYTYWRWVPSLVVQSSKELIQRHHNLVQICINELNCKRRDPIKVGVQLRLYYHIRLITRCYEECDFCMPRDTEVRKAQELFLMEAIRLAGDRDSSIVFA